MLRIGWVLAPTLETNICYDATMTFPPLELIMVRKHLPGDYLATCREEKKVSLLSDLVHKNPNLQAYSHVEVDAHVLAVYGYLWLS